MVMITLLELVRIVNFLVVSGLVIRVTFICHALTLEMWSTAFEAWSWFFCEFYLIYYWYFWGMAIGSGVTLGSVIYSTKTMDVTEASSIIFQ